MNLVRAVMHGPPDNRMALGAVVLAAGTGSRLGGRPKALLELGGVPLVARQLLALSEAGVEDVVLVTGHHAKAIEAAVRGFPVALAHNHSPDSGQPSSVRVGLRALPPRLDAIIVALADQPLISEHEITALIGAFKKRGDASMVVPRVKDDRGSRLPGNPVLIDSALREEWVSGGGAFAGRKWRLAHPERVCWFDTENQNYRIDIDTPEDLDRFALKTGHRLQWPVTLAREAVD